MKNTSLILQAEVGQGAPPERLCLWMGQAINRVLLRSRHIGSHSHIDRVVKYILNQEAHHRLKTFREEYLDLLDKFQVPYEEKHLFDFAG